MIDGSVLAKGNVTIRGGRVSAGAIVSGVDFAATRLSPSGNVVLGTDGVLTVTATSGLVTAGALLSAGDLSATGAKITGRRDIRLIGEVETNQLLAGRDITVGGNRIKAGSIASGVDFAATDAGRGGIALSNRGNLTIDAASGSVEVDSVPAAGGFTSRSGTLAATSITSHGAVAIDGATVIDGSLLGQGNVTIRGGSIRAGAIASGVDFPATEAGNGSIALSNRGNLTIDTATGNVDAGTVLSAGAFDSRSKTFAARSVTAHGAVSIDATTTIDGSLLGKDGVTVRGASVTAGAIAAGVDFEATKRSASGNIVLGADGALTVTATSGNVTAGTLLSAGDMSLTAMKIAASNITGRKDIRLTGETDANQVLGGRDITIAGAKVTTTSIASGIDFAATEAGGGSIVLSDRGNLKIDAASGAVNAGTVLTAGLLDSKSASFAARSVTANGAVSIDGATAIDGSLLSGGGVTIRGGAIAAGAIVSGVDFAATKRSASGNIVVGSEGALTLTASSGNVTAGTLLSAGDLTAAARKIVVANITGRKAIGLGGEVETNQSGRREMRRVCRRHRD
ncbi:hypothetical protein IB270_30495 [Ensifer sp. ENS05]|uniref:beta strand repeat-containing protein n=1 Tax=Ensifer sp. ENS05 TaxID=2769277 RepID=UPI00177F452D|nr:hypothetical protein [Ensifer sp. ENS05]MBD9597166.1 hypothetical protein [Ensifer sp. ENS05]